MTVQSSQTTTAGPRSFARCLLRWIERTLACVGLTAIIYFVCFQVVHITSSSMDPTLKAADRGPADWVLIERASYMLRSPRRWEVVHLTIGGSLAAKRVVGLPSEEVSIRDGRVCINGVKQEMPAGLENIKYLDYCRLFRGRSIRCQDDEIVVLGDDSRDSADSRYEGPVKLSHVHGRMLLRLWPADRFGWVNP